MAYIGAGVTRFNTADELTVTGDATIDTNTLYVDSTNNRVGIGTSSPSALLHIASTGASNIKLEDTDNGFAATELNVENGGRDFKITTPQDTIFVQGSTEAMRILDGGNVGIGTSSPAAPLHVVGNSYVQSGTLFTDGVTSYGGTTLALNGGSTAMTFTTNATEAMRIDSSGDVIVKSGNKLQLNRDDDTRSMKIFTDNNAGTIQTTDDPIIIDAASGRIRFDIASSEKMRIDSSGNLLVGTTTTDPQSSASNSGVQIGDGFVFAGRAGEVAIFNRQTSDGDIAVFRKDGTTVGSIGVTAGGVDTYIGKGTTGLRFYDGSNTDGGTGIIVPWNTSTNAARDAQMNLGSSSERYRNLYLSGGVYLGGTTSANLLDDYEEGTWTVTLTPSVSGTISYAAGGGASYTKIGQVVHISISVTNNSSSSPNGYISFNLPFVAASGSQKGRSALALYLDGVSSNNVADFIGLTIDGASEGRIYLGDDGAAQPDSAQQMDGSCYILISGSYITSA